MITKEELEDKKDYARLLYMQGEQQKVIAEKVGVSAQTITKWVNVGGWVEQRAAQNITRPELVNKLLRTVDKMIETVNDSDDPDAANGLGDKLAKFAATIESSTSTPASWTLSRCSWLSPSGCSFRPSSTRTLRLSF